MYGLKTIHQINAANAEANRSMAAHAPETRAPYGTPKPRDLMIAVFPSEALIAPVSREGLQWLRTQYPDQSHDGLAVVITSPDEIAAAFATAEAAGLRVN